MNKENVSTKKGWTRRTLLASAGAVVGATLPSSSACSQTNTPIKLGSLVSLTGGGSSIGPSLVVTHRLVVDEINAAGGVLGRKIQLVIDDDQTNPESAVRSARKMIDVDGVTAILGAWASSVAAAILPMCWESKTMLISVGASDTLAELPHQGFFVRTQPSTGQQAAQFAQFAISEGATHLYIMLPQTPFTQSIIRLITEGVVSKGIKITSLVYDGKKASLRSEVDEMMKAEPDMLMAGGYQPDTIVLAKDIYRAGFKGKAIGFSFAINEQFIAGVSPEVAEGIYALDPVGDSKSKAYARLQKMLGKDYLELALCHGYDEANLAILAMAAAKQASGLAIHDYIRKIGDPDGVQVDNAIDGITALAAGQKINYLGASGPCKFLPDGNVGSATFRFAKVHDGKLTTYKMS